VDRDILVTLKTGDVNPATQTAETAKMVLSVPIAPVAMTTSILATVSV